MTAGWDGITAEELNAHLAERETGPEPEGLACPDCGGASFELQLGGRNSGQIRCTGCGLRFQPDAG